MRHVFASRSASLVLSLTVGVALLGAGCGGGSAGPGGAAGTTGSADVLFERDILRGFDGGTTVANNAYEHYYGAYFQDRWKPSARVAVKAGVRLETTSVFTDDRQKVLGALLPPALPTNTSDR